MFPKPSIQRCLGGPSGSGSRLLKVVSMGIENIHSLSAIKDCQRTMKELFFLGFLVLTVAADGNLPQDCILDVGFLLDGSGSVTLSNWIVTLSFVQRFGHNVNFGKEGTRIGVVSFGNRATVNIRLDQFGDVSAFEKAVHNIPYKDQNTNTASGLRALRTKLFTEINGDRPRVPNVAVVLTDGKSTWEANNTIPEATLLKEDGVKIFSIGIGSDINVDELNAIASNPTRPYVYQVESFSDLIVLIGVIVNSTCHLQRDSLAGTLSADTTITTTITTPATTSTTTPTSTTTIPTTTTSTTTTTTPASTTAARRTLGSGTKIDVVFLLDSSGSVTYGDWSLAKEFIKRTVRSMDMTVGHVRVAVIEFSTQAYLRVKLGKFSDYNTLDNEIDGMPHVNQRTNVSGAIRMAYRDVFNVINSRSEAKKVIVLVTDGQSNTDTHLTRYEANAAKLLGIRIFTVGIGKVISIDRLKDLASRPYYYFVKIVNDYGDLLRHWDRVAIGLLSDGYPEENNNPRFEDCPADIVFLVDVAGPDSALVQATVKAISDAMANVDRSQFRIWLATTANSGSGIIGNIIGADLRESLSFLFNRTLYSSGADLNKVQNVGVIVSNENYDDTALLEKLVRELKEKGAVFVVMAIGKATEDRFLETVASEPKESSILKMANSEEMRNIFYGYRGAGSSSRYPLIENTCKMSATLMWSCSFEEMDNCLVEDDREADFTWRVSNKATPSRHTGPDSAYSGQYYTFIEASSPRRYGDRAVMYLPFTAGGTFCLSFYYHMFGFHVGVLDVFVLEDGKEEIILWRMAGQKGRDWLFAEVVLNLHTNDKIGIRGTRGEEFSGDIGLDLLRIRRECILDIGIIMDASKSRTINEWLSIVDYVKTFARRVDFRQSRTRIGIIVYGGNVAVLARLNQFEEVAALENAIDGIDHRFEHRRLEAGLRLIRKKLFTKANGDRHDVPNVVIILSAGTNKWKANTGIVPEATLLKKSGVKIFTIGFGSEINVRELKTIASRPLRDHVLLDDNFLDMKQLVVHTLDVICSLQKVSLQGMVSSEERNITISDNYLKPSVDVALLIDTSHLDTSNKRKLIKTFIKQFARLMHINKSNNRVAVITYSAVPKLSILLGEESSISIFDEDTELINFPNKPANMSAAITLAYRHILSAPNRNNTNDVILIVTGGDGVDSRQMASGVSYQAESYGFRLFVVGIGRAINIVDLLATSSKPHAYYSRILPDYTALLNTTKELAHAVLAKKYPNEMIKANYEDCAANVLVVDTLYPPSSYDIRTMLSNLWIYMKNSERNRVWIDDKQIRSQHLEDALKLAIQTFDKLRNDRNAQDVIIVVSNHNNTEIDLVETEVQQLKEKGIRFLVMAIGDAVQDRIYRIIASEPKEKTLLYIANSDQLQTDLDRYISSGSLRQYPVIVNTCKMSAKTIWFCGFEVAELADCNIEDDMHAEFTWTITNKPTPSHHTGPNSAAYNGDYYAFIEGSKPRKYGDRAMIEKTSYGGCLEITVPPGTLVKRSSIFTGTIGYGIQYSVPKSAYSEDNISSFVRRDFACSSCCHGLNLRRIYPISGSRLTSSDSAGFMMLKDTENISSIICGITSVGFRGMRGRSYASDIALDALRLRRGPCIQDL
ncbi:hypothetical protein LSH36_2g14112 [Paralvinella palmiformis]|uniref:Uncharacterized protein n=1 Tax=Paralvinella palmiformis TaxID=53620 RepID=A0AAD9KFU5_9ANNE|nr:hypothetical protein LSH36_2g14112 [Paralvinella palmiformis]